MPQDRVRRQRQANNDKAFCINKSCKNYRVEVDVQHGNLTCPECGKTMQPIKKGSGNSKKGLFIGIAAVVVVGGAAWFALSGDKTVPVSVALSDTELTDTVGKSVPLAAVFQPIDSAKAVTWESADQDIAVYDEQEQAVKLLKAGETEVKAVINDSTSLICKVTVIGNGAEAKQATATKSGASATDAASSSSEKVGKYVFGGRAECVKTGDTYEITFIKPYELDLHNGTTQVFGIGDKIEGAIIRHGKLKQGEYVFKYGGRKFISGISTEI
jgi:hypothetical protein